MNVLKSGETEIASQKDYRAGVIGMGGINDAFDIYLAKFSGGYRLIIFMKIQFFFNAGNGGQWKAAEKIGFVNTWKSAIQQRWSGRLLKTLSSGSKVTIDFRFETQIGGWMMDHWEVTVEKVKDFAISSVNPVYGNVSLDSQDLKLIRKVGGARQRGVVHEFGHMLGLEDEYFKSHKHHTDYRSVMNGGEAVHARHDAPYMGWLNRQLQKHGIN